MKLELGAEPKKVYALAGLLVVAAYLLYTNVFSGGSNDTPANVTRNVKQPQALAIPQSSANVNTAPRSQPQQPSARRGRVNNSQEWVPRLGRKPNEPAPDAATVDPTLRLDLLARLQNITLQGGERSLFDFSSTPIIKQPDTTIKPLTKKTKKGGKDVIATAPPPPPQPVTPTAPSKPQAPPVPLKFYGFVNAAGGKRAFFLNGDDIFTASEGQTIQARYKIVRIGVNSAVIEDTQFSSQQTIKLEEAPLPGSA